MPIINLVLEYIRNLTKDMKTTNTEIYDHKRIFNMIMSVTVNIKLA